MLFFAPNPFYGFGTVWKIPQQDMDFYGFVSLANSDGGFLL